VVGSATIARPEIFTSPGQCASEHSDRDTHKLVNQAILVLERNGPAEGRPLVGTIARSIPNMKELRPGRWVKSEIRILFAVDPWRSAILLIAGDKAGQWERWYREAIPRAEQLYESGASEGARTMGGYRKWRDTDHLERAIETAGGPEIFYDEVQRLRDQARGWRLAELRAPHRLKRSVPATTPSCASTSSPPAALSRLWCTASTSPIRWNVSASPAPTRSMSAPGSSTTSWPARPLPGGLPTWQTIWHGFEPRPAEPNILTHACR
jgi:hypothetical protein